jgi:hypothetical protein
MYCGGVPLAGLHPGEGEVLLCLYGWVGYLRRTARSLMTRAGIAPDHAERALGHVIGGVRGV